MPTLLTEVPLTTLKEESVSHISRLIALIPPVIILDPKQQVAAQKAKKKSIRPTLSPIEKYQKAAKALTFEETQVLFKRVITEKAKRDI